MGVATFLKDCDPDCTIRVTRDGPLTAQAFFALCEAAPETECKLVIQTRPGPTCYFVDQVSQGRVFINLDDDTVTKHVSGFARFDLLKREIKWLEQMRGNGRSPVVQAHCEDLLVMNYLGEPLRRHNLPDDWAEQAEDILAALEGANCSHNDIKCDNLVVRGGNLSLIDFGWATQIGQHIPANWPQGIGKQHRLAVHRFDDRHAIYEACRTARAGYVRPSVRMVAQ